MITINGEVWRILIVPPYHPVLMSNFTSPALGCCDDLTKTIYINTAQPIAQMREVIRHEIAHAYMYSYNIDMPDDIEEILADFYGVYGEDMINSSILAYRKILP